MGLGHVGGAATGWREWSAALRGGLTALAEPTPVAEAGAFWQMATPGPGVAALYRSDPRPARAVVDVEPRLVRILTAQLAGLLAR